MYIYTGQNIISKELGKNIIHISVRNKEPEMLFKWDCTVWPHNRQIEVQKRIRKMQVAILAVVLFRPLYVITLKQKFNIYIQNHIRSGKKDTIFGSC